MMISGAQQIPVSLGKKAGEKYYIFVPLLGEKNDSSAIF